VLREVLCICSVCQEATAMRIVGERRRGGGIMNVDQAYKD
jgi:hypothetical protein